MKKIRNLLRLDIHLTLSLFWLFPVLCHLRTWGHITFLVLFPLISGVGFRSLRLPSPLFRLHHPSLGVWWMRHENNAFYVDLQSVGSLALFILIIPNTTTDYYYYLIAMKIFVSFWFLCCVLRWRNRFLFSFLLFAFPLAYCGLMFWSTGYLGFSGFGDLPLLYIGD